MNDDTLKQFLSLPIFSKMTDRDVDDVIEAVSAVVSEHGA